jgi:hypothetical protein
MIYNYETFNDIQSAVDPYTFTQYYPNMNAIQESENGYYKYYQIYSEESTVEYRLNNFLFRSNHFENINHNSTSILYSGCSLSYGTGLPEEYLWSSIISKKINKENLQTFNLSVEGGSVFLTIKNIMTFIRKYGKPEYIFVIMPPIERNVRFDKKNKKFYNVIRGGDNYFNGDYPKVYIEYIKDHKTEDDIMLAVQYIKMFEDFCNHSGIKLTWTFWHIIDKPIYDGFKFDNLIFDEICFSLFANEDSVNIEKIPYWGIAQDNLHPGYSWHYNIGNYLYETGKINHD